MLHKFKKQLPKFYTHILTALVVLVLFMLQFVVINGNPEFYKDSEFWFSLAVTLAILLVINEIYWKHGSSRGELDNKYLGSSIEYSIRVNHIKNNNPSLIDDFYTYIDELNIKLYIDARNELLDSHRISRNDYYYGQMSMKEDEHGNKLISYGTPHCELNIKELKALTKVNIKGEVVPYYTKKQIRTIVRAIYGDFKYEKISAAEILSGAKFKNNKFATHYDAKQNKRNFALSNAVVSIAISVLGAMLGASIVKDGWSPVALFVFFYRLAMVVWRAISSDEGGYNDIAEVKRTVNINRTNVIAMYARNRDLNALFKDLDTEIAEAKELINSQLGKETNDVNKKG